jgi:uncharacterized protein (DUF1697 family)|tara:strand:- start:641 stop:1171 length:531 start_codon:yes stop_codon:yes gene_type:complete
VNTFIAFFKSINVGGKNILPMRDLIPMLEDLGLEDVSTYIQSGNVVFRRKKKQIAELPDEIGLSVEAVKGFKPQVLILDLVELQSAIAGNPFDISDGKSLHFFFLDEAPNKPDLESLSAVQAITEKYELIDKVLYLYAPDGVGRSKLAAKISGALGVPVVTARNWNTVSAVLSMAE